MAKPIIVTFYSFRGGVGRSLAMLNAGWILARTGSRVLLIDFDLEAPGLTQLVRRKDLVDKPSASGQGVANIVHQYLESLHQAPGEGKDLPPVDLSQYLVGLEVPKPPLAAIPRGSLHLLPAGAQQDYPERLQEIRSREFADRPKQFARALRTALTEAKAFDYVLVDARTGLSDEAYLACRYLCDHLVLLTALNDQNIEGTAFFLQNLATWKEQGEGPGQILLVASPVPEYEDDPKAQRLEEAEKRLRKSGGAELQFRVHLPYHPRLALDTEMVAKLWPESGLGRAYQHLADYLRFLAQDRFNDWASRAREAMDRGDAYAALAALHRAAAIDQGQAARLMHQLAVHDRLRGRYAEARQGFGEALAIERELGDRQGIGATLHSLAVLDSVQGRYAEARQGFGGALAIKRELGDRRGIGATLDDLAQLDRLQGRYAEARQGAEEALAIFRELGDRQGVSGTLHGLAELDRLQGRYAQARQGVEEALAIFRELGDRLGVSVTLHRLAVLDRLQGRYAQARRCFEEALVIFCELGDRQGIGATLCSLAELDRLQGRYQEARRRFEEALAIDRELGDRRGISVSLHSLAELDRLQGRYEEARRGFEEALAIDGELGNPSDLTVTELYLQTARAQESPSSDLGPLRTAAGAARACPDPQVAAASYARLGEVLRQGRELAEARAELTSGIEFAQAHGLRGSVAEMQAELALVLADASEPTEAADAAGKALAFFTEQDVAHPHLSRLRELAAKANEAPK